MAKDAAVSAESRPETHATSAPGCQDCAEERSPNADGAGTGTRVDPIDGGGGQMHPACPRQRDAEVTCRASGQAVPGWPRTDCQTKNSRPGRSFDARFHGRISRLGARRSGGSLRRAG